MIQTLFLGSNYEALETLRALHEDSDYNVIGVITQPDKPIGRGRKIEVTEIKQYALDNDIDVIHTNNDVQKYQETLETKKPELIICKSFGEIIPSFVLQYPKYGAINIHFSLLPKYRGAVPIQKAIMDGEKKTGITIIKMSEKLDAGDILAQEIEPILEKDTNETLRKRLVQKVPEFLIRTLDLWVSGTIKPEKQDENHATYCYKEDISKANSQIKWDQYTAKDIERMVRALIPWPIAWTIINGKRTKIIETDVALNSTLKPTEFYTNSKELLVGTKENAISIKRLQMEGKKPMDIGEFLNGTKVVSIQ